jgi:hypothetical protein
MILLGDIGQLEARFGLFGDSVNLGKDRCTVCGECTTGMETISGAPNGARSWRGASGARFGLFGDSVNRGLNMCTVCELSDSSGGVACRGRAHRPEFESRSRIKKNPPHCARLLRLCVCAGWATVYCWPMRRCCQPSQFGTIGAWARVREIFWARCLDLLLSAMP